MDKSMIELQGNLAYVRLHFNMVFNHQGWAVCGEFYSDWKTIFFFFLLILPCISGEFSENIVKRLRLDKSKKAFPPKYVLWIILLVLLRK